jgi:hypothetical protein
VSGATSAALRRIGDVIVAFEDLSASALGRCWRSVFANDVVAIAL